MIGSTLLLISAASVWAQVASERIGRPAESFDNMTVDGAWCWFADPRAVYHQGQRQATYVGWVSARGDIEIGQYDHSTDETVTTTIRKQFQQDDHANPALLMLEDGRLMAFYSAHGGKQMYYRITTRSEDILSWGREQTIDTNVVGPHGYTYPNPIRLSGENNRIYLFWRGGNFKPNVSTSDDGIQWSRARTLIETSGARPYVKYDSNGFDSIHFAFTDGHPRKEEQNSIYFACYRNGAFYRADGTRVKRIEEIPLTLGDVDQVYDGGAGDGRAWIWDIAVDSRGNPVVAYAALPTETDHRYRYARWSGRNWNNHEIARAGKWFPQTLPGKKEREPHYSGGVVLDHADPSVVYLSRTINGVFEIEQWKTTDAGQSWSRAPITANSTRNNIRPLVARGSEPGQAKLFWMHGDYFHYTRYRTMLKMR